MTFTPTRERGGFISWAFPVPHALSMPATGLDISDHSVKYLRFREGRQGREVDVFGEVALPPGAVVAGDIKDQASVAGALLQLAAQTGTHAVRAALSERKGYLFQTAVPKGALGSLSSVIEFQLEEHVPIAAAESIFDVEVIGERGGELLVNVTVFPRRAAEGLAETLQSAGLLPLSFEMEPQALARAIVPPSDTGTYMIVDFGETKTGLSVAQSGVIRFTSSIEVAGSVLTNAIMKHFSVDRREATRIKNEYGLTRGTEKREFYDLLMSTSAALRDEINRHYIYWHTHEVEGHTHDTHDDPDSDENATGDSRIEKIYLVGGNANIRGLAEYLSISMRADVVVPSVWRNAFSLDRHIPPIDARDSLRYATAIGLALRTNISP